MDESFKSVYAIYGLWGIVGLLAIFGIAKYGNRWIQGLIDKSVDKRLANYQHELDKALESHKQELADTAAKTQLDYQRTLHDFTLYAIRRHEATMNMYKVLLDAEVSIIDMSRFLVPDIETCEDHGILAALEGYSPSDYDRQYVTEELREGRLKNVEREMIRIASSSRISNATKARNTAREALHQNELYISKGVESVAEKLMEELHSCVVSHVASQHLGADLIRHKNKLRMLMIDLKRVAQADLGRSFKDM